MKIKVVSIFILLVVMVSMFSSCTDKSVHYSNIEDFELAFEEDNSVVGDTVTFTVKAQVSEVLLGLGSGYAYKIQASENRIFYSKENPNVNEGEVLTVKITNVYSFDGSNWFIICEIVE